jgi:hypothetical protein
VVCLSLNNLKRNVCKNNSRQRGNMKMGDPAAN